jgi:single-strand DNA-binding protein
MNNYTGIGRLTREVELRYLPNGSAVAKTGFVTSKKYKDKITGETKEKTMFIDLVIFGKSAETFNQFMQKGHRVAIIGSLEFEQWTDKEDGKKRSKHLINVENFEFLESKSGADKVPEQQTEDEVPDWF